MKSIKKKFANNILLLKNHVNRFALIGLLFSLFLIIFAMILVAYQQTGQITWSTFLNSQKNNPVLWILNLTPFLFLIWGQTINFTMTNEANNILIKSLLNKNQSINKIFYNIDTRLPNRVLFIDLLTQAIEVALNKNKKFSVVMIDVINFKKINDAVGFRDGMKILEQIGARLRKVIHPPNMLAHLGENEFSIISFYANKNNKAIAFARQIQKIFETPFSVGGVNLRAKVVIGIALYPAHGKDAETLIRHANMAIHSANEMQIQLNIYHSTNNQRDNYKNILIKDLQNAISNDELMLQFQPKINLKNGKIVGAETLIYWPHPVYGILHADDFVPFAKRMGLSQQLTHWMLKKSIKKCLEWQKEGFPINISINLSMIDFITEDLVNTVINFSKEQPLPMNNLTFELPEDTLMINKYQSSEILTMLSEQGIRLSVKNYGLGYCPLAHLCELPIHEIKIDKSYVATMNEVPQNEMIVQSLIALASHLNLEVVAEGITSKETQNKLIKWQCDYGQGTYISDPKKPIEMLEWYKTRSQ